MASRLPKPRRSARVDAQPSEFYRELAETLPHMAWTARADGAVDYFNPRVFEYTGRTQRQLEGWGWQQMVHADDWDRCLARWTKAFKTGAPYEVEYRLRRHDGRYFWHLGAAMPLRANGRIVRWVGTCTDIENQKRAERLLAKARESMEHMVDARAAQQATDAAREREVAENAAQRERQRAQERFRSFMESVPAIGWSKNAQLRYDWLSASYCRLHGKTLEEMRGRDDFELWPEEAARLYRKDDELALRANGPVQFAERSTVADGSVVDWLVVKFPMPDASGALGVAGIGFDITDDVRGAQQGAADAGAQNPFDRLSARERQVMQMVVDGHTSAEVAERLALSPKSVDTYRSRLMAKLGVDDLPSLVKLALRRGLTTKR
jgi:PAS domain S-box-containing protein